MNKTYMQALGLIGSTAMIIFSYGTNSTSDIKATGNRGHDNRKKLPTQYSFVTGDAIAVNQ